MGCGKYICSAAFCFLLAAFCGSIPAAAKPQSSAVDDSVAAIVRSLNNDSLRAEKYLEISKEFFSSDPEAAIRLGEKAFALCEEISYRRGAALSLKNIGIGHYMTGRYVDAIQSWNRALEIFREIEDKAGVANMLSNLGAIYFNQADDVKALGYYLESLKVSEEINDSLRLATVLMNIGAVYFNKPATHDKAFSFYMRSLPISEALGDQDAIGTVSVNLGEIFFERHEYDSALRYFEKSLIAFEGSENIPYSYINIGKVYAEKGNFDKAIENQQKAYDIAEKLNGQLDMTRALLSLANTHRARGDNREAIQHYLRGVEVGKAIHANIELKDIYKGLADSYGELKEFKNAYLYQQLLLGVKDTLYNIDADKKLGTLLFNFELEKKENRINLLTKDQEIKAQEIKRQRLVKNGFIGGFTIVLLFAGVFFAQRNRISKEKKRSDELLLNILPEETAEELKATGTAKTRSYESVTVLFTDFKNFTQASEILSAEELVSEINYCYSEFDKIMAKYGIEKIKTIGDSYMCAGGLPVANQTHPVDTVNAGIEMIKFIERNKADRIAQGKPFFELRMGIHTGSVIAGIVGIRKFAYDIWGDTVNTASRMESSGEVGKVNISEATYELIKGHFHCTSRGKVKAKNKGEIEMYFVEFS